MSTIQLEQVEKTYKSRERRSVAVNKVSLTVAQGEFVFLVGSRGAGKSTLLAILAGELRPDAGAVLINGVNMTKHRLRERSPLRRFVGYVPQVSFIEPEETVTSHLAEGKRLELLKNRLPVDPQMEKALSLVGMSGCGGRKGRELTNAECRRVEVARAILTSPDILLLDEVTDRMDDDTVWDLMHLFTELNSRGTTIIMATNASSIVNAMRKRVVTLADGKIIGDVQKGRFGQIPGRTVVGLPVGPRRSRWKNGG